MDEKTLNEHLEMFETVMQKCHKFIMTTDYGPIPIEQLREAVVTFRLARRSYFDTVNLLEQVKKAGKRLPIVD